MCSQLGQTSLNWLQPTKLEVDVMGQGNVFTSVCLSTGGTPRTAQLPLAAPPPPDSNANAVNSARL